MNRELSLRKLLFVGILIVILLVLFSIYEFIRFNDGKLHLVFCNVGQGDAIFIRTPSGLDVLVDGGPDDSVLSCLSSHMPFWDRTIELIFLTHPHADHMRGLLSVMRRYNVLKFNTENLENDTVLYKELVKELVRKNIKVRYLYAGDRFKTKDNVSVRVLSPSQSFLSRTSPHGKISESKEFGSLIILLSYKIYDLESSAYKNINILLTGDSQISGLEEAIKEVSEVKVLQVPHHGSRFGLDQNILNKLNPKLAVISVGKNSYGHPSKQVLELLKTHGIKTMRTDKDGAIHLKF